MDLALSECGDKKKFFPSLFILFYMFWVVQLIPKLLKNIYI